MSEPIVIASWTNRLLLLVVCMLVAWNLGETKKLSRATEKSQKEYAVAKTAADANTKRLLEFIDQWNITQKELSDWIRQNAQTMDYLQRKNPKIKVPKSPPIPPSLSHGETIPDKELNRATPAPVVIEKKVYIKPKERPKEWPWWKKWPTK